jgi:DNA-binding winged helix-turn-helix (wHTH) protein
MIVSSIRVSLEQKKIYEFPGFRLDAGERLLLRDGEVINLTPKSFDLLHVLVEHPGRLLTKEELLQAVWPDAFVEENNLADNISKLRKALGDRDNGHRYIETVPKQGYRFAACVTEVAPDNSEKVNKDRRNSQRPAATDETSESHDVASRLLVQVRIHKLGIALILSAITLGIIWGSSVTQCHAPPIQPPRTLTRLTFEAGLQTAPTWSQDGRILPTVQTIAATLTFGYSP